MISCPAPKGWNHFRAPSKLYLFDVIKKSLILNNFYICFLAPFREGQNKKQISWCQGKGASNFLALDTTDHKGG